MVKPKRMPIQEIRMRVKAQELHAVMCEPVRLERWGMSSEDHWKHSSHGE